MERCGLFVYIFIYNLSVFFELFCSMRVIKNQAEVFNWSSLRLSSIFSKSTNGNTTQQLTDSISQTFVSFVENPFVAAGLKNLAMFTYEVTMPYLNFVEKSSQ